MTLNDTDKEIAKRQTKRNNVLGLTLIGFVVLVFAITIVKMSGGHLMEAYDHGVRPSLLNSDQVGSQQSEIEHEETVIQGTNQ